MLLDSNVNVQVELTPRTITSLAYALCAPVLLWAIAMVIVANLKK